MSETDSFIDEVTEEVRRDKLFAVLRKYGWIGIAAVLLIVGGAAWSEWQKARARAAAEGFGDALVAALDGDDPAARVAALAATAPGEGADAAGARRAVAAFLAADEVLRGGDRAGALARIEALAEDAGLPESYRQLARLKSVILAGTAMEPARRDATLAGLAEPGAPFRVIAKEQQAIALMADGKDAEALALAQTIMQEAEATPGLKRRVARLIVALGGDPDAG